MITKAFSYLRVSGDGQIDGDGFERQRETIRRYASQNSMEVVEEFRDEGIRGTTELENRPGLAALLAAVETNGVRLVLIEIPDRLARDLVINELLVREFQKASCRVISCSGNVDLTEGSDSNPTARFIRQILAAVAELDKSLIVLKTRAARERLRLKNGKCEGRKSYPHTPQEKAIYDRMVCLDAEGYTLQRIALDLNANHLWTRSGKPWNFATIHKILRREESK